MKQIGQPCEFANPHSQIKQIYPPIPSTAGQPQASPTETGLLPHGRDSTHVSYSQAVFHGEEAHSG